MHARRSHWRAVILHPQRIYRELKQLARREGGEEAIGRFQELLRRNGWHPTDTCALRRFAAFSFVVDCAKPYNWGPRGKRLGNGRGSPGRGRTSNGRRSSKVQWDRLATLGQSFGGGTFGWSLRGVSQAFFQRMMASGDGVPVDRSTVREVFADLASVGLVSVHQPPPRAKVAPFERSGKYCFSQYWAAMVGMERKPAMRGALDVIDNWAERIRVWFAELAGPPLPAS